jgi:hypothetical protein
LLVAIFDPSDAKRHLSTAPAHGALAHQPRELLSQSTDVTSWRKFIWEVKMRVQNQMQIPRVMAAGLVIASALFAISPAAADDRKTCTDSLRRDVAIAACTRAITSGLPA